MTDEKRLQLAREAIREFSAQNSKSRKAARAGLMKTGIYTRKGKIRAEYGGEPKAAKTAP